MAAAAVLLSTGSFAQTDKKETPKNWYQLDQKESGYYGISLDKAYAFLKAKKAKSKTVLVAVIDSGVDTLHEDLKPVLWTNPKEIPGNGIDDDHNGYIDDIHGWNFIGGKDGRNVKENSLEADRVYQGLKSKYEGKPVSEISPADQYEFDMWRKAKAEILGDPNEPVVDILQMKKGLENFIKSDSMLKIAMQKDVYTGRDLDKYDPVESKLIAARKSFLYIFTANSIMDMTNKELLDALKEQVEATEKEQADKDKRKDKVLVDNRAEIVKDNENDFNDRYYGNNDVMANTPFHGTHCSGIIAAARNNGKGMNGIADNVRIMMVRAVPDGDEHDKDIANAILYAVNNGAQVISMSFGKYYSPQKQFVDEAVKYAESKGVLLIHAAGNESKNSDEDPSFPRPVSKDNTYTASNWINVGASGDPSVGGMAAFFSNYGKKSVDVFSPGVQIYSTIPGGNTYGNASGTSMACPVVAGIAALILEYNPNLSAQQIKYVIEKSAQPVSVKAKLPGTGDEVNFSDLSKTGGLVNAYEAIKLAATLKGERKTVPERLPKPKMVKNKKG